MKTMLATALAAQVLAIVSGCSDEEKPRPATARQTTADSLIAFARAPSDASWDAVPFADTVALGLAGELVVERTAMELRDPGSWNFTVSLFRGRSATVSALALIANEQGGLRTSEGERSHCASDPVQSPTLVAKLRRILIQPAGYYSCLAWWTVDAFVNGGGEIEAVTLDLWEP